MLLALDITATFSEPSQPLNRKEKGKKNNDYQGWNWVKWRLSSRSPDARGGGRFAAPAFAPDTKGSTLQHVAPDENHVLPGQEVHYWNQMCTSSGVIHFVIHPPHPSGWLTAKCSLSFISLSRVTANATRQIPALTTWQTQSLMKDMWHIQIVQYLCFPSIVG